MFVVAIVYRIVTLFRAPYPPSSDIGLHASIINLILQTGKIPVWNPYQMGGGPYPIPPGYHVFTSIIVLFTGIPLYIAEPLVSLLLSSFVIFPAYLISKRVWKNNNVALLSAFIVILSNLSIEMVCWGGYPNISALALFPIVAYLILKDFDSKSWRNILLAGLLMGSIIFAHLFSFLVFSAILIAYAILFLLFRFLRLLPRESLKNLFSLVLPMALGVLVALPWLLMTSNAYAANPLFGTAENREIILLTRQVDIGSLILVTSLFLISLLTFRVSKGKWIDIHSLMIAVWFIVPVALTQSYRVGVIVDYVRFVYFGDFPGHLLLAALIFHITSGFLLITKKLSELTTKTHVRRQIQGLPLMFLVVFLLAIVVGVFPTSLSPAQSVAKADFYTVTGRPEYSALEWIQQETPTSSVLASDNLYGWWLSGFAQRPTLSAVPLQYLLYPFEIQRAKETSLLLDTDYSIDNGLIQVREDGAYFARHNPIFYIQTKQQTLFSLLHFNESETTFFVQRNDSRQTLSLYDLNEVSTQWTSKNENLAVLNMTRENDFLHVEETLIVQRGVRFAELTYEIEAVDRETAIDWVRFIPHIIEGKILLTDSMLGLYDVNQKVSGQVIFEEQHPEVKIYTTESVSSAEFLYTTEDTSSIRIRFLIGVFDAENMTYKEVLETYEKLLQNPKQMVANFPITEWDYLEMIKSYNISFVICRDKGVYPKFLNDPGFQAVYSNQGVIIFKVTDRSSLTHVH